ncbi:MAG: hypothetical protein MUF24_04330 [Chitinophagaceae bacterium]|jgi:hypothetical protein|nr:hypothetical protein [Chitinophagaceae bacterium]
MWTHDYEHTTPQPVGPLWTVLADVKGWVAIDQNIERLDMEEEPRAGATFTLKPKGGPLLKFVIDTFLPPYQYADLCKMPGAQMRTLHKLEPLSPNSTCIKVRIEIKGPLAWLWGATIGKKHAQGLPSQTQRFVTAAMAKP